MAPQIRFQRVPLAFVVADFFAGGANGQQPAQNFNVIERGLEFQDQPLPFLFRFLAGGDVAHDQGKTI